MGCMYCTPDQVRQSRQTTEDQHQQNSDASCGGLACAEIANNVAESCHFPYLYTRNGTATRPEPVLNFLEISALPGSPSGRSRV